MRKLKILGISLAILLPLYCLALTLNILYKSDLSMAKPYERPLSTSNYSIHFVTYATGPEVFHMNRNIEAYTAINKGIDFIYLYRREHIDSDFMKDNPILNEKFGAGYWLWKPYFILKTLEKMPENDVLIYGDSSLLVKKPIVEFIAPLLQQKDIVLFDYYAPEYGTASRSAIGAVFKAINCQTETCYQSPHVWAGILVLKNTPKSRQFIREWLSLCKKPELLTGSDNSVPNQPNFSHHQHDEGILGAVAAVHSEDVYFQKMNKDFWTHFGMDRRKTPEKSMLMHVIPNLNKIQKKILKFYVYINWKIQEVKNSIIKES